MHSSCKHMWNFVDSHKRASDVTMFTNLPADLIDQIRFFGATENLSASAVLESAVELLMKRLDDGLGNELSYVNYFEERRTIQAGAHEETTLQQLLQSDDEDRPFFRSESCPEVN